MTSLRQGNVPRPACVNPTMYALAICLVVLDFVLLLLVLDAERTEREEIERRALRSRNGEPTS